MSTENRKRVGQEELDMWVSRLSAAAMWTACVAITMMTLHVTADVIGKYLFRAPVPATFEAVEAYYMVALVFLPLSYIVRSEGHIVVELFTRNMPRRGQAALSVFTGILTLIWVALLAWYGGKEAVRMTADKELLQIAEGFIYVWPSRWAVPLGCGVMGIAVLAQLAADATRAARR